MKNIKKKNLSQGALIAFFVILCLIILVPLLLVVSISFSNEIDISKNGYKLIPENLDLSAYKYVFNNPMQILNSYKITAIFSIASMVLSVFMTSLLAYPLSVKELKGRKTLNFYVYFTMIFSGGLVPSYILITQYLHLDNTIWVYILTGVVSPWYVFMMRTSFAGIPKEITESAFMDGASDYKIYFRFILPLSKPVLATVALFVFLAKWNDWNTALLYIDDEALISLQYLLQRILKEIELIQNNQFAASTIDISEIPSETARMAMAVIVAGPALLVFPFFQKYFVKGLTVGSVKG